MISLILIKKLSFKKIIAAVNYSYIVVFATNNIFFCNMGIMMN